LTGLLFDADGERLTPSHALKKRVRYRYYVSRHLITGDRTKPRGLRLPALGIEALNRTRIEALLANPEELISILPVDCDRAAVKIVNRSASAETPCWVPRSATHAGTSL
jgi:hypothetical protein